MKSIIFATLMVFLFLGCEGNVDLSPKKVNWDRDECKRCAMMLSDKDFAAQVVSMEDGKTYFFDDIGCAIIWLSNAGNPLSLDNVKLYVKNSENDKFIDAKEAIFTTDRASPMRYNFLAHDKKIYKPKVVKYNTFEEIVNKLQ